jgi:hypothetical protein
MTAKIILQPFAAVLFLAATANLCSALEDIEIVTKERAKELGLEVRVNAAGPEAVRIELEFETKGELQNYTRVALEMRDGEKLITSSTLKEEPAKAGRIIVGFAADRASLNKIELKVVTQDSPRSRSGHILRVHEFVELAKLR